MTSTTTVSPDDTTSTEDFLPVWLGDDHINPSWITKKIPEFRNVIDATVTDISNASRKGDKVKNGATLLLDISFGYDNTSLTYNNKTLVIKQMPASGLPLSQQLGLAREAHFFTRLASRIKLQNDRNDRDSIDSTTSPCIPKVYYAYGNMQSGTKFILMEDLSCQYIDSGILFGPGNPNNWDRDLPAKIAAAYPKAKPPSSYEVANETFLAIAQVHATFWKDTSLLSDDYDWLRGAAWINGKQEESWKKSQGVIQEMWKNMETTIESRIQWDPLVKTLTEKAMAGISWEAQRKRLNPSNHFTLVHGDFWPGNIMISTSDSCDLRLLDWEMVGVGSGPQDLGQYIISNMDPAERRECEISLIQNYYMELVRLGVELKWEECWKEYQVGGLERWLWFLVYFCAQEGPILMWAQFFHDQIKEFVHDHNIQPGDITQPRP
ncbi:ecdysteroid kinase [Nitzschia inconspicua]|uniref:Ecdysteroid kinase n=1 Tax=Nitzschia inconspicua TaxID=303405 RepID=A0A9K3PUZ0_9STRA|nr:ecdysteroid kinase [Nitzschia inconspicua]